MISTISALRGQITNHNTNIKKYTKEKTEILKILGEINGLIEEIKSTKGINNKAKEDLDVLIRLVDGLPQIDQELKDDELVDVLGILKDVKGSMSLVVLILVVLVLVVLVLVVLVLVVLVLLVIHTVYKLARF